MPRSEMKMSNSITEVNACVSTQSSDRRGATQNTLTSRQWVLENQIGISLTILITLFAVHNLYPSLRPYTTPFLELPYYQPEKGVYFQGYDDVYFVMTSVVAFTAVRAITMDWIFQPIAHQWGLNRKGCIRFAEQGWQLVYYGGFWSYGMYLWYNSKYWFNFWEIWTDWPTRDISGVFKWYLLMQLSFWLQQIVMVNVEERRKDHYQMLTHHVVTSILLFGAYTYGFYNVANVVLATMDIVDLLLPAAKMLKYLGYEAACTVGFVVFLVTWAISRHGVYPILWWSIYKNVPAVMPHGCYSRATGERFTTDGISNNWSHLLLPFQSADGPICMSPRIKWVFLSFLAFLQILSLIWFTMVLRVAVSVLRTGGAEDTRSDDEEDSVDVDDEKANGLNGAGSTNGSARMSNESNPQTVISSGSSQGHHHHPVRIRTGRGRVTLSDQNERKALLGRIGCDKPT
ncbi:hypothetical protein AJ80_01274 [Polytolypa hystricis UAMH7299]|uniref:TLC domain-containing protein n=1 Tax=Polytolypa hystricis (strain UAMH7299) TaxID=1447883 RepID=A0A2B7Z2M8_POLH7|nr:hypothetical protein AJ80_01274 [Polytolypa hystricis UAMH7299]